LFGFIGLALISQLTGCSYYTSVKKKTKKVVRDIKAPDDNLQKIAGIIAFKNKTVFQGQNLQSIFQDQVAKTIEDACNNVILLKPGEANYPNILVDLPRSVSGRLDNLAIVTTGKKYGLNALVNGALVDIREKKEKRGIPWFKKTHYYIQIQVEADVYDTETGTKLFDESITREVKVDAKEFEVVRAKIPGNFNLVLKGLRALGNRFGEKICDSINVQPWKGFIVSNNSEKVTISSGQKVGLKAGDILEVYSPGELIKGPDEQQYVLRGPKTGEIRITNVYLDRSEAVAVEGDGIDPGSTVRLKP
jgi:hypothetical protein